MPEEPDDRRTEPSRSSSEQPPPGQPTTELPRPDQPVAAQSAAEPPPPPPVPPVAMAPAGRGRFGHFVRHRATQIVAAAMAGVLVGGGVVALVDGDRDGRPNATRYYHGEGPHRGGGHGNRPGRRGQHGQPGPGQPGPGQPGPGQPGPGQPG